MEPVRHTRPEPEAWPELIDFVQQVEPKHSVASYPGALKIARRVEALSATELDQNAYYGYGKLMCGLAQRLQDPEVRDDITTKMAVGLVRQASKKRGLPSKELYKPVVGDLADDTPLSLPFFDPTRDAWKELAPAEKLLSKSLTNTTLAKRKVAARFKPDSFKSKAWRRVQPHAVALSTYMFTPKSVVGGSTTAGPSILWRAHLSGLHPGSPLRPEQEAMPIDIVRVAEIAKKPGIFTPPARLRMDEMAAGVGWSKGCPSTFDRSVLKLPPRQEIYPGTFLLPDRTERLGCEALFVGRLVVDIATDMIPTALEKATTLTPKAALQLHRDYMRGERD